LDGVIEGGLIFVSQKKSVVEVKGVGELPEGGIGEVEDHEGVCQLADLEVEGSEDISSDGDVEGHSHLGEGGHLVSVDVEGHDLEGGVFKEGQFLEQRSIERLESIS